jgi:5-methylcytosine-specific restriction endonuclease McrA
MHCGKNKKRNSQYCSQICRDAARIEKKHKYLNETGCVPGNPRRRKEYLIKLRGWQCEICQTTEWMGKQVPLVCDHINGNPTDHKLENLRLLCQNCNAQTDTFAGKNKKGNGRFYSRPAGTPHPLWVGMKAGLTPKFVV